VSKRFATAIQWTRARRIMYAALLQNCFRCVLMGKSNDAVSPARTWCWRTRDTAPHVFFALAQTHTQRYVMHLRDGLPLRNLLFPRALSLRRLCGFSEFTVCSNRRIFKFCVRMDLIIVNQKITIRLQNALGKN
jgi:hypothetical protein